LKAGEAVGVLKVASCHQVCRYSANIWTGRPKPLEEGWLPRAADADRAAGRPSPITNSRPE
jgi:hypothetical protein